MTQRGSSADFCNDVGTSLFVWILQLSRRGRNIVTRGVDCCACSVAVLLFPRTAYVAMASDEADERKKDFAPEHQLELLGADTADAHRVRIIVGDTLTLGRVLLDAVAVSSNKVVLAQESPGALFSVKYDTLRDLRNDDVLRLSPVAWPGAHRVTSLSCGLFHTAFVSNGCVFTLGQATVGQLGVGATG